MIQERPYSAITVRDITERADIGRSTFYSHFDSKEELLFDGFDHWLMSLASTSPRSHDSTDVVRDGSERPIPRFCVPFLRHIRSERRFFEATMVGAFDTRIHRKVTGMLVDLIRLELVGDSEPRAAGANHVPGGEDELALEARAQCLAGAFLALAAWWLRHGESLSAETVAGVFAEVAGLPPTKCY